MRELMRVRDFRLLLAGQTLSMFGDTAMLLTLGMWAKELTGSNAKAGAVFAVMALPSLLAPFGGLVIDRFKRRTVMIVVDLATAAAVLLLLLVDGREDLWLIYVVALLYGASLILFSSARSAFLHSMLPAESLGEANGMLSTVREAMRLVGPAAGAGLYAWLGGPATATLDAVTFLVSAACLWAIRLREQRPVRETEPLGVQLSTGFRHLLSQPVLRAGAVATIVSLLAIGLAESVYFAVVDEGLGKSVEFLGLLQVAMGVGAIAGGVAITSVIRKVGELKPVPVGFALITVGSGLSLVPSVPVVALAMVAVGAGLPVVVVCINTMLQLRTPAAIQGRVFTTFEMVLGVPQTLSIAAGAALIAVVAFRIMLTAMTIGLALATVYSLLRLREDPATTTASEQVELAA